METAVQGSSATERATGEATPPDAASLAPTVEAILISLSRPVSAAAIAQGLAPPATPTRNNAPAPDSAADPDTARPETPPADASLVKRVKEAIAFLNASYEQTGRAFRIEEIAGGYRLMTLAQYARGVAAFHMARQSTRLSKAAIETLAIIAYKQPITRADLEAIRGVACGEVLRSLTDRRLVTIKGRAEELGRPLLYGTTKAFLDVFGLATLVDLPQIAELKLGMEAKA